MKNVSLRFQSLDFNKYLENASNKKNRTHLEFWNDTRKLGTVLASF